MYLMNLISQVSEVETPVGDVFTALMNLLGGVKGASILGISVLVVQLIMLFFNSSLAGFAGKYKLLIVYGLTAVSVVLGNLVAGGSLVSGFLAANALTAFQVFGNQIWRQFVTKADEPAIAAIKKGK